MAPLAPSFEEYVDKWLQEEKDAEFAQVIYVDIKKTWRGQYRWVAKNSKNNKKVAISGESFINREDCLKSAWRVTGQYSTVFIREGGYGLQLSRRALSNPFRTNPS
jgi:hypothetical protein